jgi:enoyl-CoA hydratase/carnithine racemase
MPDLLYEKKGKIAYITINRPAAYNAMTMEMWHDMLKFWLDFRDDPNVWVAIITGTGDKAFCAGADLKQINQRHADANEHNRLFSAVAPWHIFTRGVGTEVWKPVIAAVNGMALGGGLEIAVACDIRIASENATLGVPEVKAAVIPGVGGTQRLPRLIPWGIALEMLMTGDSVTAQEAYRVGLVNKVVPLKDLIPTAEALANRINENAPLAVRCAKEAVYRGVQMSMSDGLRLEQLMSDMLLQTADGIEGPAAFSEKRKAKFTGFYTAERPQYL